MSGKHASVALFIPHIGCPHRCVFCEQRSISGSVSIPHGDDVVKAAQIALSSDRDAFSEREIAFFGGSFTAVNREYMIELLQAAYPFVKSGEFSGIRISTRPDAIDEEILLLLRKYGVRAIELGAQSMNDDVLALNERGHCADDVRRSASLIRQHGFSLGLQMMTGMYGSSYETDSFTARELATLKPDTIRIYPTIVMKNTRLEKLYGEGKYVPSSIAKTVELCVELQEYFEDRDIRVIRMGLHSGGNVEEGYVAGPYHPAFGELCTSRKFKLLIERELALKEITSGEVTVTVAPEDISSAIGHKKSNKDYFGTKGIVLKVKGNSLQKKGTVTIENKQ